VIWAPGWVDESFSWSTIPSTSWSCSYILVSVSSMTVMRAHVSSFSRAGMVSIVLCICSSCYMAWSSKYCTRSVRLCTILSNCAVFSYKATLSFAWCILSVSSCYNRSSIDCCCLANWLRIWVSPDASVVRSCLSFVTYSANWLPAVCTLLMEVSASYCHLSPVLCFCLISAMYVAWACRCCTIFVQNVSSS
jgi:hypothetical protein